MAQIKVSKKGKAKRKVIYVKKCKNCGKFAK